MASDTKWFTALSFQAKAEILSAVLHEILDHMPEIRKQLPEDFLQRAHKAQSDCSIDCSQLTEEDIILINRWFRERGSTQYGQETRTESHPHGSTQDR